MTHYLSTPLAMHYYRVERYGNARLTFRRVYAHPYWGWQVEEASWRTRKDS